MVGYSHLVVTESKRVSGYWESISWRNLQFPVFVATERDCRLERRKYTHTYYLHSSAYRQGGWISFGFNSVQFSTSCLYKHLFFQYFHTRLLPRLLSQTLTFYDSFSDSIFPTDESIEIIKKLNRNSYSMLTRTTKSNWKKKYYTTILFHLKVQCRIVLK